MLDDEDDDNVVLTSARGLRKEGTNKRKRSSRGEREKSHKNSYNINN
jgi:hypothetical protein